MEANWPFYARLREARQRKAAKLKEEGRVGYSQERLGIDAGIDEASASARVNQYEQGKHLPDLRLASRFAELLDVPLAYLFCEEDELAVLILEARTLSPERLERIRDFLAEDGSDAP